MTGKKEKPKTTDEIQNGGKPTLEERVEELEEKLETVIRLNCLIAKFDG